MFRVGNHTSVRYSFRELSSDRRFLLWGFVLALAFDFRKLNEKGDIYFQIAGVLLTIIFGSLYILLENSSPRRAYGRLYSSKPALLWSVFLVLTIFPTLIWDVNLIRYLKVLLPYALFGLSLMVMLSMERRNGDPMALIRMFAWGALINTIWLIFYALFIAGLDINTIRYEIISPAIPLLIGFGVAGVFLKNNSGLSVVGLIVAITLVLLSVTRAFVISSALLFVGVLAIELKRRSLVGSMKFSVKISIVAVIVLVVTSAIAYNFRGNVFDKWTSRLSLGQTSERYDPSVIARYAEFKGQANELTKNWVTLFIGKGIGSSFIRDADVLSLARKGAIPQKDDYWNAAHSTWLYPFYTSGIVLGFIVPVVLLGAMTKGFRAIYQKWDENISNGATTAFLILLTYLGNSFTANLFSTRYGSVLLGCVVGSLYVYWGRATYIRNVAREESRHKKIASMTR